MADRIPLIVDSSSTSIKELPAGDSIILADNEKLKLGTGSDLNVYHDGSHSYIQETGTGNLILATPEFRVKNQGASEQNKMCG